jgi:hypothetical protein
MNPDHLFLGTQLDNIEDRDRKKRFKGKMFFADKQIRIIRLAYKYGATCGDLGNVFGCHTKSIYDIIKGKTYTKVK